MTKILFLLNHHIIDRLMSGSIVYDVILNKKNQIQNHLKLTNTRSKQTIKQSLKLLCEGKIVTTGMLQRASKSTILNSTVVFTYVICSHEFERCW